MDVLNDFQLTSVSGRIANNAIPGAADFQAAPAQMRSLLGPLALMPGTWKGRGFNQIWRPFHGSQDRFLELNETIETLQFDEIPGDIPNRGFRQDDVNLHGVRYLQQIQDAHVELAPRLRRRPHETLAMKACLRDRRALALSGVEYPVAAVAESAALR